PPLFKLLALWRNDERYNKAARFWGKIFAISFLFGVITGIPMEFQFGTNWARFARYSGGVIATSLAMEGVFAFFLESSFLGISKSPAHFAGTSLVAAVCDRRFYTFAGTLRTSRVTIEPTS